MSGFADFYRRYLMPNTIFEWIYASILAIGLVLFAILFFVYLIPSAQGM